MGFSGANGGFQSLLHTLRCGQSTAVCTEVMGSDATLSGITDREYRRRIRAWTLYDWANSAFAATILAAVLPVYFSQVAGSTLPSAAVATAYWSISLSLSLLIAAALSPLLGTVSDLVRGKKAFLTGFVAVGVLATSLLVLVGSGDWLLAAGLFIVAKIGFHCANVFYDALLPHVARGEDRDRVSARGYAVGYLGGGLLLAVNIVMIQTIPGTWGARLSFVSVALWWAVFTVPLLRVVPEPPAAGGNRGPGLRVLADSFRRLLETLRDIRQYRQLFWFLLAFLIYNDGIGTIMGLAAIYGAELGFGAVELVLALLLVQFVGIPFSLVFGHLPSPKERRRALFLAFILYQLVALPAGAVLGRMFLAAEWTGAPLPGYESSATHAGEGQHPIESEFTRLEGEWTPVTARSTSLETGQDARFLSSFRAGDRLEFRFHGQRVKVLYAMGPDHGLWEVWMDGRRLEDPETGEPRVVDGYRETPRLDAELHIRADEPGEHVLGIVNLGTHHEGSEGTVLRLREIGVLPPVRRSELPVILLGVLCLEACGLLLAWILTRPATARGLLERLASRLDTRSCILLGLFAYALIATWGYFLDSVLEFWCLAWMVATVQGGTQALSRSLYASLSPASKSGEFFGLFGIMEKFSAVTGPLVFAAVGAYAGSSRPAVLSIIVFFIVGGGILLRVNVAEGRRIAREEDAALMGRDMPSSSDP